MLRTSVLQYTRVGDCNLGAVNLSFNLGYNGFIVRRDIQEQPFSLFHTQNYISEELL